MKAHGITWVGSEAEGVALAIHRRLPHQRQHMAASHSSVKSDVVM
jgi:hypothetical protein